MMPKLIFGGVITLAAIVVLLLVLVIVGGIVAGLLAPLIGSVPVSYNFRSIRARWTSTIVAILGIAGTVGVFVAMLSLARGFRATLVGSGTPDDALVMRAGSTSEMMGGITLDSIKLVQDKPGVARDASGQPLVTQEVVGVIPIPLISTGTDANVEARGVSPNVLEIRKFVKIVQGRMFHAGLDELVVGKNASKTYAGLTVGNTVSFGGGQWKVVGVFDAGGSSFDSEMWCDARILNQVLKRPENIFQSATVHLTSPAAFDQFKDSITSDPQLNLEVEREVDYYAKQSSAMTQLITVLGGLVAAIMAIGAVFGALNTMYSAVARTRARDCHDARDRFLQLEHHPLIPVRGAADFVHRRHYRLCGRASAERHDHANHEFLDLLEYSLRLQDHFQLARDGSDFRAGHGRSRRLAARRARGAAPRRRLPARVVGDLRQRRNETDRSRTGAAARQPPS